MNNIILGIIVTIILLESLAGTELGILDQLSKDFLIYDELKTSIKNMYSKLNIVGRVIYSIIFVLLLTITFIAYKIGFKVTKVIVTLLKKLFYKKDNKDK